MRRALLALVLLGCGADHPPATDAGTTDAGTPRDVAVVMPDDAGDDAAHFCGDHHVDPGEHCDDGNGTPGDGCEPGCDTPTCTSSADCPASVPVCSDFRLPTDDVAHCRAVQAGAVLGAACASDADCASGWCDQRQLRCSVGCATDSDCGDGPV